MYRILVPVDGNADRAKRQARYVLSRPGDPDAVAATVLHVSPREADAPETPAEFAAVDAAVAAADLLETGCASVERLLRSGAVTDQILACAREREVDEIVVGARARSSNAMGLVGSTSKALLQSSEHPVVVTT